MIQFVELVSVPPGESRGLITKQGRVSAWLFHTVCGEQRGGSFVCILWSLQENTEFQSWNFSVLLVQAPSKSARGSVPIILPSCWLTRFPEPNPRDLPWQRFSPHFAVVCKVLLFIFYLLCVFSTVLPTQLSYCEV